MDRYVIIIGAMKSGTTTLFELLARHPAIAPASDKEPGFFAFEDIWARGFEWYHGLFEFDPTRHRYRLEASTDYTKYPFADGVWDRMTAREDVSVKLIYVMRHPLRRIESHARHVQGARKELGQNLSPRHDHSLDAGISQISLAASQYAAQIDQFRPALEQGALHLLTFEDLRENPDRCLAAIYAFLDLDPAEALEVLPVHNAADSKTRVHPIWERAVQMAPLMAAGRMLLPQALREGIKARFHRKITVEGRFRLTPAEERHLESLYSDDIRRLQQDHGIDTDHFWRLG